MNKSAMIEKRGFGKNILNVFTGLFCMDRCKLKLFSAVAAVSVVLVTVPAAAEEEPLFKRLGGIYGIAAAVDDVVGRLYVNGTLNANPAVNAVHQLGGQAGFKYLVTAWSIEHTGGPKVYPGRPMDKAHEHLNISDREFDVVMTEIKTSLYKFNVPEREFNEFVALLESYRPQIVKAGK
jgi:hemoglobin